MFGQFKLSLFLFTCSLLSLEWAAQIGLSGVVEDKYSCPHGWTRYGSKKCLKYVSELQDYERAQATCRSKNQGTLVTVHSHEEQNFVYSYIHSIAASSTPIWLGAKQIDFESILWLDKTENSYTNWAPSEPSHPDEICIAINPRNGLWHDVMCTEANVPACERAPTTQWPFFVAFCSEGWFQFNDEKCVRIISSQALNFYESQELCRSKYNSKLLSIKTDKESEFVHNLIKFRDVKLPVWLGAVQNDFSSFNWIDKSDVTFTNWAEGEPNDPDHACISMVASGGKWSDNDCKEQKLILCQKVVPEEGACETGWLQFRQDKCYRFVHIRLAFDDAETLCSNLYGGHLPSIHSQEEQFMIAQFLASVNVKNGSEIWLGGRQMDFHNFNWGDGSPFNYSYWEQGEPSFPAEKCIEMSWRNGRWNDINCRLKRAVLCERQVSSRHHLKPILYNQSPSCLGDANCTAATTQQQTTSVAGATGAQSTGLATVVLASPGSELAPAAGEQLQLATVNSANGTSSASNLTSLVAAATPTLNGDPQLTPDDKPIKVIASIMNREQQQQSPQLVEPHHQRVVVVVAASSLQSNKSSSPSSGLTSKSASAVASEFGAAAVADQLPQPVASSATNSTVPTQSIHYNLPPPERMFDETSQPPPNKLEDQQKTFAQEEASLAATVSAQPLQQQQEQPPGPINSEPTVSLLDKLKQTTTSATAASLPTTTTTSLPEFTKASDSNTTALNAPAENIVAGADQQQQQQMHSAQSVAPAEYVAAPAQLVAANETPAVPQPAQTTQEFAQVTQSAAGGTHQREKIDHASEGGVLDSSSVSAAPASTGGVK